MPEKRIAMIPVDTNVAVNRITAHAGQIFVFTALSNAKVYKAAGGVSTTIVTHTGLIPFIIFNPGRLSMGHLQARINPYYGIFSHESEGNKKLILECFSCFSRIER